MLELSSRLNHMNEGILKTIEEEPDKFIAYNNGLTATATGIEINEDKTRITRIDGFQIVNGGQTTNSILGLSMQIKWTLVKLRCP